MGILMSKDPIVLIYRLCLFINNFSCFTLTFELCSMVIQIKNDTKLFPQKVLSHYLILIQNFDSFCCHIFKASQSAWRLQSPAVGS